MSLKIDISDAETLVGENSARTVEFFQGCTETWDLSTDRGVSRQKRYGSLYMYHMDSP